ncbi:MAG: hypothetical protein KGV56_01990 [Gammaproteobacteria bacterium]|nr:hypothetical protein [Gammaproteobacteria bacterium]
MLIFDNTFIFGQEEFRHSPISLQKDWLHMRTPHTIHETYAGINPISSDMILLDYNEIHRKDYQPKKYCFSGSKLGYYRNVRMIQDGEWEHFNIIQFDLTTEYFQDGIYINVAISTERGNYVCCSSRIEEENKLAPLIGKSQDFFIPLEYLTTFFTTEPSVLREINETITALKNSNLPWYRNEK